MLNSSTFTLNAVDSMRSRSICSVSLELVDWGRIWGYIGVSQVYDASNFDSLSLIHCLKLFEFGVGLRVEKRKRRNPIFLDVAALLKLLPPCSSTLAWGPP